MTRCCGPDSGLEHVKSVFWDDRGERGAVRVRECTANRVMREHARVACGASPASAPALCA